MLHFQLSSVPIDEASVVHNSLNHLFHLRAQHPIKGQQTCFILDSPPFIYLLRFFLYDQISVIYNSKYVESAYFEELGEQQHFFF